MASNSPCANATLSRLLAAFCLRPIQFVLPIGSSKANLFPRRVSWIGLLVAGMLLGLVLAPQSVHAVTPESPEVRKLIEEGKQYLEEHTDERLGGKCLIGLVFLKDGASLNHPRIQEALAACKDTPADKVRSGRVYNNGLAIIFLAELEDGKHRDLISRYADIMKNRQKANGGWGYESYATGDTPQTQYAALSFWELWRIGKAPSIQSVDAGLKFLLLTQQPDGAWGYQGSISAEGELQKQSQPSLSMLAAGMGGTMILGNMAGLLKAGSISETEQPKEKVPDALKKAKVEQILQPLGGSQIDPKMLNAAILRGQKWYDKNFSAEAIKKWQRDQNYAPYLLYSLERYKSFEEFITRNAPDEPHWYQVGYEYLKKNQLEHGGWHSKSKDPCATAFAVLFLMRSTQKILNQSLGQGTLIGGRGLHSDLSRMKMRAGRLVTEQKPTQVDQMIKMLEGNGSEDLEALLKNPAALRVNNVGPQEARRLQQVVKSGSPEARALAVRAISRLRDLDYVPTLLYAMTDPDKRVVREARDGLRYVSRRFGGFGLTDNFDDGERYNVLDKWKKWYLRLRPDALILP